MIKKKEFEKKSLLWQRVKKGLFTGILSAGLIIMPAKKVEGYTVKGSFDLPTGEIVEQMQTKYPKGWKMIKIGDKLASIGKESGLADYIINYFSAEYEKTGDDYAIYGEILGYRQAVFDYPKEKAKSYIKIILSRSEEILSKVKKEDLKTEILVQNYYFYYYLIQMELDDYKKKNIEELIDEALEYYEKTKINLPDSVIQSLEKAPLSPISQIRKIKIVNKKH